MVAASSRRSSAGRPRHEQRAYSRGPPASAAAGAAYLWEMFASMHRPLGRTRPSPSERDRALDGTQAALQRRAHSPRRSSKRWSSACTRPSGVARSPPYLWAMPLQTVRWLRPAPGAPRAVAGPRFHVGDVRDMNATALGIWAARRRGDLLARGGPAPDHRPTGVARRALAQAHARARSSRLVEEAPWHCSASRARQARGEIPRARSTSTC